MNKKKQFVVTIEHQDLYNFDGFNMDELLKEAFKTEYSKKFYDDVKVLKVEDYGSQ